MGGALYSGTKPRPRGARGAQGGFIWGLTYHNLIIQISGLSIHIWLVLGLRCALICLLLDFPVFFHWTIHWNLLLDPPSQALCTLRVFAIPCSFSIDRNEHALVLEALRPLEAERKCYRLVGGVLVERTAAEVRPAIEKNIEGVCRPNRVLVVLVIEGIMGEGKLLPGKKKLLL